MRRGREASQRSVAASLDRPEPGIWDEPQEQPLSTLSVTALSGIPLVEPDDALAALIAAALDERNAA